MPTLPAIERLPASGAPRLLFVMLHGVGARASQFVPVAEHLQSVFPHAAFVIPEGFSPADQGTGRQWFSIQGVTEDNRPQRVAAVLPALADFVRAQQNRFALVNPDTALVGFSQGAILALEMSSLVDGLVGRVLAFSGRYAKLPERAPDLTSLHLLHGEDDRVVAVSHARAAFEHLADLNGDVTLDIASHVGHVMHPVLIERASYRLQTCIPLRTWRRALGVD